MNKLLSVAIPAYNNPILLKRAIDSILFQTYRPLEIVINDDNSPISLESLIKNYQELNYSNVEFIYTRNKINLGYYLNNVSVYNRCKGEYFLFFHHDDYIISKDFFQESVNQLIKKNTYIVVSNSIVEGNLQTMMEWKYEEWAVIAGTNYLNNYLYSNAHPSISSVVMNRKKLSNLGYQDLYLKKDDISKLGYEIDEAFLMVIMLCLCGNISVNGKIYTCRGNPILSYSKSNIWREKGGAYSGFIPLYNYYLTEKNIEYKKVIRKIILKIYVNFNNIDFNVILFFKRNHNVFWDPFFIIFLGYFINKRNFIFNIMNIPKKLLLKIVLLSK